MSGDTVYAGQALLTDTTFSHGRRFYTAPFEEIISTDITDVNWLSVLPDSGSSTDYQTGQSHTVRYDSDRLALGEHNATITITDPNARNNPRTISVTLTISE